MKLQTVAHTVWHRTRAHGAGVAGVAKAKECQTCPRLVSMVENGAVRVLLGAESAAGSRSSAIQELVRDVWLTWLTEVVPPYHVHWTGVGAG
jgi:hypothetical protein